MLKNYKSKTAAQKKAREVGGTIFEVVQGEYQVQGHCCIDRAGRRFAVVYGAGGTYSVGSTNKI